MEIIDFVIKLAIVTAVLVVLKLAVKRFNGRWK